MDNKDLYNKMEQIEKMVRETVKTVDQSVQEHLASKNEEEIRQLKAVAGGALLLVGSLPFRKKHPVLSTLAMLGGVAVLANEAAKVIQTTECMICEKK